MRTRLLVAASLLLVLPLTTLAALIPGDANADGVVNFDDFHIWEHNVGKDLGRSEGDFNNDCTVDGDDFGVWQNEFTGVSSHKHSDANGDHTIDSNDYLVWVTHFGESIGPADGDFNGDCKVNGIDFLIWLHHFGDHSGSSSSSSSSYSSSSSSESSISSESSSSSSLEVCGDGVEGVGEQCDDGNTTSGDGCSNICVAEVCGNGTLDAGEQCDDGNIVNGDGCSDVCQVEISVCGDGIPQSGEECDDGNIVNGDGCSALCMIEGGSSSSGGSSSDSTSSGSGSSTSSSSFSSSSSSFSSVSSFDPCEVLDTLTLEPEALPLVEGGCDSSSSSSSFSSESSEGGDGSSSSFSSDESSSSSESAPIASPLAVSGDPFNGAHHGHMTDVFRGVSGYISGFFGVNGGGIAPGGFGGTNADPFSDAEKKYLCSMKEAIPSINTPFFDWYVSYIAGVMGRTTGVISDALKSTTLCAPAVSAQAPVKIDTTAFAIDADGYPISSNPVWNACIRGQGLSMALILSNPDHVEDRYGAGRPLTCRDYHIGDVNVWTHPDHKGMEFTWIPETKKLTLPTGFVAVRDGVFAKGN